MLLVSQGGSEGELLLRRRATAPTTVCRSPRREEGHQEDGEAQGPARHCGGVDPVDTVDANSQDYWAAYHVLKAAGQKLVDDDLFADIKRATEAGLNNHRTVVFGEEEEEEEEEGEEGEGQ